MRNKLNPGTQNMDLQVQSFPLFFSFLLFLLMLLRLLKKSRTQNETSNLPPGPWRLPVIGNLHQLIGSLPHQCLHELAKKHGPIMHLKLGEVDHIIVSSPEVAKEVMKTHDVVFAQRPFLLAADMVAYNSGTIAFAPYGDYWRQMRKICTLELLSSKRVQSFKSVREEEISNLVRYISSNTGSVINLSKLICSLTYGITARVAFGEKCKDQDEFIPMAQELTDAAGGFSTADVFPSVKILHRVGGMLSRLERLHQEMDKILEKITNAHKVRRKVNAKLGGERGVIDLVDVLLDLQDHGDLQFPLESDHIKAVILDMFIAGSETTSTAVEWAMSEMLKNPIVMTKAQEEVRQVFGTKGFVDESCLSELNYLKLVIKETLRLHPPLPMLLPRECMEKCTISRYQIPKSYKVIVNAWAIGRDPNYWNEADTFFPERFLDSSVDYRGNNFEYIPFGAGRRVCPGISFGMAIVEVTLANLLYHFDWKLPGGIKPEDLDMDELFGATVRRKNFLNLIPFSCSRQ